MFKGFFLDRDGVINEDRDYVHEPEDFVFCDGIFELCARIQKAGYRIVIITNQSGVARGYYDESQLAYLHSWMRKRFESEGVEIAAVYYCPHHPEIGIPPYRCDCDCRKPKPGMVLAAERELNLDLAESVLLGDKLSDMEAARSAGVGRRILLGAEYQHTFNEPDIATEIVSSLGQIRLQK